MVCAERHASRRVTRGSACLTSYACETCGSGPLQPHSGRCVGISVIVDDINEIIRRCEENGIPYVGPKPLYGGYTGVRARDPDGRGINFFQDHK